MKILSLFLFLFLTALCEAYQPTPENIKTRAWFENARFGLFIHWGPSSLLGAGEWVMHHRKIQVEDYQNLIRIFNPIDFDAKKWVKMAKDSGMRYITFITRHHDGFSNWNTHASNWKITKTPYGKDVLKMLADECRKQGIKLCLYYSLLDWARSDYPYETGRTGTELGRKEPSNYAHYLRFMKKQLTELLTEYGEISAIWFDGHWDQTAPESAAERPSRIDWRYDEIYSLIHELQPGCLIGNNHHQNPFPGEDFQIFEKDQPGENEAGLSFQAVSKSLPLESCETINNSWGFNITDNRYKSFKQLIALLVRSAGYGANLLLNIGPMPNGEIQPQFEKRLLTMGKWLKHNGETIYGAKGGFLKPQKWGAVTQKGDRLYLHLLNFESPLALPFPYSIKSLKSFKTGAPLPYTLENGQLVIQTETLNPKEVDNIIEITLSAQAIR